jgi:hypothetical protein
MGSGGGSGAGLTAPTSRRDGGAPVSDAEVPAYGHAGAHNAAQQAAKAAKAANAAAKLRGKGMGAPPPAPPGVRVPQTATGVSDPFAGAGSSGGGGGGGALAITGMPPVLGRVGCHWVVGCHCLDGRTDGPMDAPVVDWCSDSRLVF